MENTSPSRLKRFRVHILDKRFHHMDVLAESPAEADSIALSSSELWIDDDEGGSESTLIESLPDGEGFPENYDACQKCGRTLPADDYCVCQQNL